MKRLTFALMMPGLAMGGVLVPEDELIGKAFGGHSHETGSGARVVHSFGIEPALTGRDLILTSAYRWGGGSGEFEQEAELEWAFTRNLGVILELPWIHEEGGAEGFGDLAVVPRWLFLERDRFLLTAQIEAILPTGSDDFGGELALAPGFAAFVDLGGGWTLNSQIAVEQNLRENETVAEFGLGLARTFGGHHHHEDHEHHECDESPWSIHFELTGGVGLAGEEEGEWELTGLVGISRDLLHDLSARVAYEFPLNGGADFDHGVRGGIIWHF